MTDSPWQLEMGARVVGRDRVRFRVWAPNASEVQVEMYPPSGGIERYPMDEEGDGAWNAIVPAPAGTLYRYHLNDWGYPDPCSRSQPEGVHGPSQVVDPNAFTWTDGGWHGVDPEALVIYELHVGAYTNEGTFDALAGELDALRELGVTALELMPIAEFPGKRNWGYDGVNLFAPSSVYGGADALRRLVDAAHARGLGVILDVVYNHLGPDGNYLRAFAADYFTDRYRTPWGDALNFDGPNSDRVRRYFVDNALYWFHEFHIDGLRLDATHRIFDEGGKHFIQELAEAVHQQGPAGRRVLLVAEDERNELRLVLPREEGGYGLDALWVDDFHHSVHVLVTGEEDGFLGSYEGTADEVARLLRVGYLYPKPPSGPGETPAGVAKVVPAHQLVYGLQNHDQVGNRPFGKRLAHLTGLEKYKAASALLLLVPCTPLVFMGDEFAASSPFLFFTDHAGELGEKMLAGRIEEFREFWSRLDGQWHEVSDPQAEETYLRSRVDLGERNRPPHDGVYRLFQELLRLRRDDPVLRLQQRWNLVAEGLGVAMIAVERWDDDGRRRLLLANLGEESYFAMGDQEWLGEAVALTWQPMLSTAEERFAGPGVTLEPLAPGSNIVLPAGSATLWAAQGF
jgi:maltooligosyltrehalose trehalohydrolase